MDSPQTSVLPSDLIDSNGLMAKDDVNIFRKSEGLHPSESLPSGNGVVLQDMEGMEYTNNKVEDKSKSENILEKRSSNMKNPPIKLTQEDLESVAVLYGAIKGVKGSLDKTSLNKMSSTFDFHVGNVISKLNERLSELEGKKEKNQTKSKETMQYFWLVSLLFKEVIYRTSI